MLHHVCRKKCLNLVFEFEKVGVNGGWSVQLLIQDAVLVDDPGPYQSKKQAKSVAAQRAIPFVESMPSPTAGKSSHNESEAVNWVGALQESCQKHAIPQPAYQEYQFGSVFWCVCTLPEHTTLMSGKCPTKKSAKQNAAKEVMEALRAQGVLPQVFRASAGEKHKSQDGSFVAGDTPPGLGRGIDTAGMNRSFAQQVHELCQALGISPPEYRFFEEDHAPGFLSGGAVFDRGAHLKDNPIGQFRHVYGKKAAKEECAKAVLIYLRDFEAKRKAAVAKAMAHFNKA